MYNLMAPNPRGMVAWYPRVRTDQQLAGQVNAVPCLRVQVCHTCGCRYATLASADMCLRYTAIVAVAVLPNLLLQAIIHIAYESVSQKTCIHDMVGLLLNEETQHVQQ